MFWIFRVPDHVVSLNLAGGKAEMSLNNQDIEDYHDLLNALLDGPSMEAKVSFDCRWFDPIATTMIRNPDPMQQFVGLYTQTHATLEWSAKEEGFEFQSAPPKTSSEVFAEIGEERNGFFFS